MKNILKVIIGCLIVLVIVLVVDFLSIFIFFRPVIGIKDNNVYKGMFFNVHNCSEYSIPQIKSKFSKYNCSEVKVKEEIVNDVEYDQYYRLDIITNGVCDNQLKLYYDGEDRDIYLSCIDEVYVRGEGDMVYTLTDFIQRDMNNLDKLLNNYYGNNLYDGRSTVYNINYGGVDFIVNRCNTLNGNKNVYIGTSNMQLMCN